MATQLHAVVLALTEAWSAAPALDGVKVVDGPQANADQANEWLFVGFEGDKADDQTEGASAEQDWAQLGGRRREENGQIVCAVITRIGTADAGKGRTRAWAIISAAEDVLRSDPKLGDLVIWADVTSYRYIPTITDRGTKVRVVFTVRFKARI